MNDIRFVELDARTTEPSSHILSPRALLFVGELVRAFRPRVEGLLTARRRQRLSRARGVLPDFRPETAHLRTTDWKCLEEPPALRDRRVDVSGPADLDRMAAAFAEGATSVTVDLEDATSPTWDNVVRAHRCMRAFVREATSGARRVVFLVPRGLHQVERHVLVDGGPSPAALVDVGLHAFHNAEKLAQSGAGPFFKLPKLESLEEARFWNDVFVTLEKTLRIPRGTLKATVVVETLPALFELHEMLWELREHSAGAECGRYNLVFDFVRKHARDPRALLPDREELLPGRSFMASAAAWVVQTCHRRGVHAIGGKTPLVGTVGDRSRDAQALTHVRGVKLSDATMGFDGTVVIHPTLARTAREVFDAMVDREHQLDHLRDDVCIRRQELLSVPRGARTERGVREEIRACIRHLDGWLAGRGRTLIGRRWENAASAETARVLLWQSLHHRAPLAEGGNLTVDRFRRWLREEAASAGVASRTEGLVEQLTLATDLEPFMTVPAYELLIGRRGRGVRHASLH